MMKITLYGLHGCPMCKYLEQLMNEKHYTFVKIDDEEKVKAMGLDSVPTLEVDGTRMNYGDALKFIRCSNENGGVCASCVTGGWKV